MNIFIRYAAETDNLPNRFMTKAYDDRMLFVLDGEGKIVFEETEEYICKNTLCYYPAGVSYLPISSNENPLRFITINFDFERKYEHITRVLAPVSITEFAPEKVLFKDNSTRTEIFCDKLVIHNMFDYRNIFSEIVQEYKSDSFYGKRIADGLLQTLCYKILNSEFKSYDNLYLKIKNYIDNNYKNIHINRDIASVFSYHEYYLNYVFKKNFNTTIHKYITDLRLRKACYLIETTDLPICDIAYTVGFANANHFSTKFKSKFSITPSMYRKYLCSNKNNPI